MRRLTDRERDEAARWHVLLGRFIGPLGRRSPGLWPHLADARSMAAIRLARRSGATTLAAWLCLESEAKSLAKAARRRLAREERYAREPRPISGEDGPALAALAALTVRQREAVETVAVGGIAPYSAAKLLGCSAGSVKYHYRKGLAQLRTLLEAS